MIAIVAPPAAADEPAMGPQAPPDQVRSPGEAVEEEVRGNVLRQPVGLDTLEVFNLPPEFVQRVSDRIIRSSFEQRSRRVVQDAPASAASVARDGARGAAGEGQAEADRPRTTRLIIIASVTAVAGLATIIMALRARKAAA